MNFFWNRRPHDRGSPEHGGGAHERTGDQSFRPEEGRHHLLGGGRTCCVVDGDGRTLPVAVVGLQAGRGLPGLSHVELYNQGIKNFFVEFICLDYRCGDGRFSLSAAALPSSNPSFSQTKCRF